MSIVVDSHIYLVAEQRCENSTSKPGLDCAEGHGHVTVGECPGSSGETLVWIAAVMRCSVTRAFFMQGEKRLTLERVETGYTFKSPGLAFFRHLSANSFHFFFIFFLTLDSPPTELV